MWYIQDRLTKNNGYDAYVIEKYKYVASENLSQ